MRVRSLARVSAAELQPGDSVLLRGGERHSGPLTLDQADAGEQTRPVTVGSYGTGRARIDAGRGPGVAVTGTAGVVLQDLDVTGSGRTTNTADGISFFTDRADGARLRGVRVQRVEVSGFRGAGVVIGAWTPSYSGFDSVHLTAVDAHDNGDAGISSYGWYAPGSGRWSHRDIRVERSRAHDNPGNPGAGKNSGNGIVLSGVDGAVIAHSRAYRNGALNDYPGGGLVGIWAWEATRVTIRHNESYANATATLDGGGFDLDGGVTSSVLHSNLSHDNAGAGYLIAEFAGAGPLTDVVVRDNISIRDGRRNSYGGITVYNGNDRDAVRRVTISRNLVVTTPALTGEPPSLSILSPTRDVTVRGNTFVTQAGLPLLRVAPGQEGLRLRDNRYLHSGSFLVHWQGTDYTSLEQFRRATGQDPRP